MAFTMNAVIMASNKEVNEKVRRADLVKIENSNNNNKNTDAIKAATTTRTRRKAKRGTSKRKLKLSSEQRGNGYSDDERASERAPSQKSMASTASTTATSSSERQEEDPLTASPKATAAKVSNGGSLRRKQSIAKSVTSMPSLASFETDDVQDGGESCGTSLADTTEELNDAPAKGAGRKVKRVLRRQDSDLSQDSTIVDSVGSLGNFVKPNGRKKRLSKAALAAKAAEEAEATAAMAAAISAAAPPSTKEKKSKAASKKDKEGSTTPKRGRKQKSERNLSCSFNSSSKASSKSPARPKIKKASSDRQLHLSTKKSASERDLYSESGSLPQSSGLQLYDATASLSPRAPHITERRLRKGARKEDILGLISQSDHVTEHMQPRMSRPKSPKRGGLSEPLVAQSDHITENVMGRRSPRLSPKGRRMLSDPGVTGVCVTPTISPQRSKSMMSAQQVSPIDENAASSESPELTLDSILASHEAMGNPISSGPRSVRSSQSEPCARRMPKGGSAIAFSRKTNPNYIKGRPRKSTSGDSMSLLTNDTGYSFAEESIPDEEIEKNIKASKSSTGSDQKPLRRAPGDVPKRSQSSTRASQAPLTRPVFKKAASDRFLGMSSSSFAVNDLPPQSGLRAEPGSEASLHQRAMAALSLKDLMQRGKNETSNRMRALSRSPSRGRRKNKERDLLGGSTRVTKAELGGDEYKANRTEIFDPSESERIPVGGDTISNLVPPRRRAKSPDPFAAPPSSVGGKTKKKKSEKKPKKKKSPEKDSKAKATAAVEEKPIASPAFSASDDWECATHTSSNGEEPKTRMVVSQKNLMADIPAEDSSGKKGKIVSKWGGSAMEASMAINGDWDSQSQSEDSKSNEEFEVQKSNRQLKAKEDPNKDILLPSPRKIKLAKKDDANDHPAVATTGKISKAQSRWASLRTANDFIRAAKRKLTVDEYLTNNNNGEETVASNHVEAPQIIIGGDLEDLSPVTTATKYVPKKSKSKRKGKKKISSTPKL